MLPHEFLLFIDAKILHYFGGLQNWLSRRLHINPFLVARAVLASGAAALVGACAFVAQSAVFGALLILAICVPAIAWGFKLSYCIERIYAPNGVVNIPKLAGLSYIALRVGICPWGIVASFILGPVALCIVAIGIGLYMCGPFRSGHDLYIDGSSKPLAFRMR